jgi:hypothetical protein
MVRSEDPPFGLSDVAGGMTTPCTYVICSLRVHGEYQPKGREQVNPLENDT